MMNGVSEKQINYALDVREKLIARLDKTWEQWNRPGFPCREDYPEYTDEEFAADAAWILAEVKKGLDRAREIIMGITEAREMLDNGDLIVLEAENLPSGYAYDRGYGFDWIIANRPKRAPYLSGIKAVK